LAVQEVALDATTTVMRAVIAGEPWHITAPPEVTPLLAAQFGHLPGWQLSRDPVMVTIQRAADAQPDLRSQGTVQWRDADAIHQEYPGVALAIDDSWSVSVTLFGPDALATAVRTEVLTRVIMLRAAARGLVPLHGAGLGADGRSWVIPAIGGTGKSTATAVAVAAGLRVLGDDLILWDPADDCLHSVSGTLRLLPESLHRFPVEMLADAGLVELWDRHDGKVVLRIPNTAMTPSAELAGLLLIGAERPAATGGAALRALSSSMFQVTRVGLPAADTARSLAALAVRIPVRALQRDPDLHRWGATLFETCRRSDVVDVRAGTTGARALERSHD
jgi:hypothetical protein